MTDKRIEKLYDGSLQPAFADPPQLSSARVPWSGFLTERDPCIAGHAASVVWPHTELIMVTAGGIWVEDHALGVCRRFFAGPGSVTIWPAGYESRSNSWTPLDSRCGPTEMISMELDPCVLRLLAPETERRPVAMHPAVQDPVLATLLRLVEAEVETGAATGRMYGESLCLALASRVLGRYAIATPTEGSSRAQLSVQQRERVRDHIHANLDGDLSLLELGRVSGLSTHHFTVAFRNTFGTTPHQYILRERIVQAKRLLALRPLSIADVALTVGFASQSHFTTAFRCSVGVTPRRYRAAVR
jgi:AraC family transcriptional regulator